MIDGIKKRNVIILSVCAAVVILLSVILIVILTKNEESDLGNERKARPKNNSEQALPLEKEEAVLIAETLVGRYETYDNVGIACELDFDFSLSDEEYQEMWGLLSEDQRMYLATPAECLCCTSYEKAREHTETIIDESLLSYLTDDYVVYKDKLYFFMGNVGGTSYQNVTIGEFSNNVIFAYADKMGSGDNYCGTYRFKIVKAKDEYKLTEIVEEARPVDFDGTYWDICMGQTLGSSFVAEFNKDGTFSAFSMASNFFTGTYYYSDGMLTIAFDGRKGVEYHQFGNGFRSFEEYEVQIGSQYYDIEPTDGEWFCERYEEYLENKEMEPIKKVFPYCYKAEPEGETTEEMKYGRYEGDFTWHDEAEYVYSHIVLREDGTFLWQTNIDHNHYEIVPAISIEGIYTVREVTVEYPDDSTGQQVEISFYYKSYHLKSYYVYDDAFVDQAIEFDYVGT